MSVTNPDPLALLVARRNVHYNAFPNELAFDKETFKAREAEWNDTLNRMQEDIVNTTPTGFLGAAMALSLLTRKYEKGEAFHDGLVLSISDWLMAQAIAEPEQGEAAS